MIIVSTVASTLLLLHVIFRAFSSEIYYSPPTCLYIMNYKICTERMQKARNGLSIDYLEASNSCAEVIADFASPISSVP